MKAHKPITVAACLLLATLGNAQENTHSRTSLETPSQETKPAPDLRTVVGCLSKINRTYIITGGGPGPKQFRIISGDTSRLAKWVGWTVKVVGRVGVSSPVENTITPPNENTTTGVTYNTIEALKVRMLYQNCSEPGQEFSGDHE